MKTWICRISLAVGVTLLILSHFQLSLPGDFWSTHALAGAFVVPAIFLGPRSYRLLGTAALALSVILGVSDYSEGKSLREGRDGSAKAAFRNETDSAVVVTVASTRGESSRAKVIPPHDVARFRVTNGTAIARTTSGETLARCDIVPLPAREYYDFPSRNFYYRVMRDRIQPVPVTDAREWFR